LKTIRRLTAIGLAGSFIIFTTKPAKSNPAVLAAPAICSTGVGCVLIGVAVLGGGAYYVWQSHKGDRVYHHVTDPEEEAKWLGGPHETEPVIAGKREDAEKKCLKLAKGRRFKEVRWSHKNIWDCVFYTGG
jgi:hypothetical protein